MRSLLAIGVLASAAVLVPPTTPTAQAAVPCPVNPGPVGIQGWVADWASHGITLCIGYTSAPEVQRAMVQIIDLTSGANLHVAMQAPVPPPYPPSPADYEFGRLTMDRFEATQRVMAPGADGFPDFKEAFSVTNASFFTNTSSNRTKLSLPFRAGDYDGCNFGGVTYPCGSSYGVAIYNNDPGSAVAKKVLRMDQSGRNVQIASFPTIYNTSDAQCVGSYSCVVGYDSLIDLSGNGNTQNFRTYVGTNAVHGTNATRVFILTGSALTVAEADLVLQHFGAVATMQMDGGGSTYMRSYMSDFGGALNRAVPTVLVARYSPVP